MWYKRWKCEHIIFSFSYAHCGIDIVSLSWLVLLRLLLQRLQIKQSSTEKTSIFASNSAFISISFSLFFSSISFCFTKTRKSWTRIQYCIVNVSCTSIYLYDIANDVDDVELWHTISRYASTATARVSRSHATKPFIFSRCFNAAYQRVRMSELRGKKEKHIVCISNFLEEYTIVYSGIQLLQSILQFTHSI